MTMFYVKQFLKWFQELLVEKRVRDYPENFSGLFNYLAIPCFAEALNLIPLKRLTGQSRAGNS
ncbi:MAG: hypothetical protein NTU49_00125 [Gammaproteobacteria bacterium]|nr:hypothetical protein [Gammaproteobacteria bacterium]